MSSTSTGTATWTYSATRAQVNHFGTKVGAEFRNLYVRTGLMTESKAESLRDDICAYMSRGFTHVVKAQLVRNSVVEFELRFTLEQWNGSAQDERGRGYRRPDTTGMSWNIQLETTEYFRGLSAEKRAEFYAGLDGSWGPTGSLQYKGSGSWAGGARHHVHTGSQLRREVFGA